MIEETILDEVNNIKMFTITNKDNNKLTIFNYGLVLYSLIFDNQELLLAHYNLKDYIENKEYLGAIIGRVCNRIENAKFIMNNKTYNLKDNDNQNNLHSGGFSNKALSHLYWDSKIINENQINFHIISKENDYDSKIEINILFEFNDNNEIIYQIIANTDDISPINITNHSYWNLSNDLNLNNHKFKFYSKQHLENNENNIPYNKFYDNINKYDFSKFKTIRDSKDYDNDFLIQNYNKSLQLACEVECNNLRLSTFTSQSAIHFYTGRYLNNLKDKRNQVYNQYSAFCLETQALSNSLNSSLFQNYNKIFYSKGEEYKETIKYKIESIN